MIPWPSILIPAGVLLLLAGLLLPWLVQRLRRSADSTPPLALSTRIQLSIPAKTLRLLRRMQRTQAETPAFKILHEVFLPLSEELLLWRRLMKTTPPLPAGESRQMRLFPAAEAFVRGGQYDVRALSQSLAEHQVPGLTSLELAMLPRAAALAAAMRLHALLRQMQQDARDLQLARRMAQRMAASAQPLTVLDRYSITQGRMSCLLSVLQKSQQDALLAAAGDWLEARGTSAEQVTLQSAERQLRLAGALDDILRCLQAMQRINWLPAAEEADPLHALLSRDPAGVYPRMTITTRLQYRLQATQLAAQCRMSSGRLAEFALSLAREAPADSAEAHIGHLLMTRQGQDGLIRAAGTPLNRLRRLADRHALMLWRCVLLLFSLAAGTAFINAWHPLLIAPFFLIVAGTLPRLASPAAHAELPAMEVPALTDELRTLVIMPACLTDPSQAVAMVRKLSVVRRSMPRVGADCMLLGDFTPGMTMRHGTDGEIIAAVHAALSALEDAQAPGRYLYLQRSRSWDNGRRTYAARGGAAGAIESVCRLIAQGECADEIASSSVSPSFLHRHYAFVTVVMPDAQPAPGMLQQLLAAAAHPLCTRMNTGHGRQGMSMLAPMLYPMAGETSSRAELLDCPADEPGPVLLLRPDAYLEDIDGLTLPYDDTTPAEGALCGLGRSSAAAASYAAPSSFIRLMSRWLSATERCWQGLKWQLPFVQSPRGLVRNPLDAAARFRLREMLRESLLPLSQTALILWGAWAGQWWLTAAGIIVPELKLLRRQQDRLKSLALRTAFLPARAAVQTFAMLRGARRSFSSGTPSDSTITDTALQQIEAWSQGLCATAAAVCALAHGGLFLPAALIAGLWGCFPLLHSWVDAPRHKAEPLTDADDTLLNETAAATWRSLESQASMYPLPPDFSQTLPRRTASPFTSPQAIAGWLVSCACAPELGLTTPAHAAGLLLQAASAIEQLPMPHGLPCRYWRLDTLTAADPAADAAGCGLLLCALSAAAQAARTWLPRLPASLLSLPMRLDQLAQRIDAGKLFDWDTGLFWRTLDADGQGQSHIRHFCDEGLLLSVYACAAGIVPASHFSRLSHVRVGTAAGALPLTQGGNAEAWLLPALFLPLDERVCGRAATLMRHRGKEGVFGTGSSAYHGFTPQMTWRQDCFGLSEAAAQQRPFRAVYSPWAAALCLPYTPHDAALSLLHMRELGLFGPGGYSDAVDMTGDTAAICAMQDTYHQGVVLCACAHVLADAPLRRLFMGLPAVQACLPLLRSPDAPVLPRRPACTFPSGTAAPQEPPLQVDPILTPPAAHLVGGPDALALVSASGSSALRFGGLPGTRFGGSMTDAEGPQFYLVDEGRAYRVNDPFLGGETVFSPGEARFTRLCGSLRATLTVLSDPAGERIVHLLEIVNLSTADRIVEAADCLIPDLNAPSFGLETARPAADCLTARRCGSACMLFHRISCTDPMRRLTAWTDASAFTGCGGTLLHPASLDEPIAEPPAMPSAQPCLAFRVQLALGGRSRVTLVFTTGMTDVPPLSADELPGIAALSALQGQALAACAPLTAPQTRATCLLTGALLWQGLPHQGSNPPGTAVSALPAADLGAEQPFAAVLLESEQGLPLLAETVAAIARLRLCGLHAGLCVVCPDSLTEDIHRISREDWLQCLSCPGDARLYTLTAAAGVTLTEGAGSLCAQLEAMQVRLPAPQRFDPARPGNLPPPDKLHAGGCGGFDPENGDYLISLPAGMTTPAPWPMTHVSRLLRCTADEAGLRTPFDEHIFLFSGGAALTPFDPALPRIIRQGPCFTRWECRSDRLSITLTASCLPGHAFALRRLRIRNISSEAADVDALVLAAIGSKGSALACIGQTIFAEPPDRQRSSCVSGVGEGWQVRRGSSALIYAANSLPCPGTPDDPRGDLAMLHRTITLAPGASEQICWIAGYAGACDQAEAAARAVAQHGASELLRQIRQTWTQRLSMLTVRTPEDTLDLLINRILPGQVLCATGATPDLVPALSLLAAHDARACLLQCAASGREDALLPLAAAHYLRITGDHALLSRRLPDGSLLSDRLASLLQHACEDADPSLPVAATGAAALADVTDDDRFRSARAALLRLTDRHIKERPEDAACTVCEAAWATLLYGMTSRTRHACGDVWNRLYDRENGVLSAGDTNEAVLPGFPGNGAQDTRCAAWFLAALLRLHEDDRAWELLRALNPIHHTDDPLRTETFRRAPWLLPAYVAAGPGPAGQALPGDGAAAAAWLYAIAVEQLLGFTRRGDCVTFRPRVPKDWDTFDVRLQEGAASWHFTLERSCTEMTVDGEAHSGPVILTDDGRMHHVRIPLK